MGHLHVVRVSRDSGARFSWWTFFWQGLNRTKLDEFLGGLRGEWKWSIKCRIGDKGRMKNKLSKTHHKYLISIFRAAGMEFLRLCFKWCQYLKKFWVQSFQKAFLYKLEKLSCISLRIFLVKTSRSFLVKTSRSILVKTLQNLHSSGVIKFKSFKTPFNKIKYAINT